MGKTSEFDYWVSYVFTQKGSGNLEHGNDHINILETYSGIEWIREIEERISRHYGYSKVTILNFVPLISENELKRVETILDRAEDLCEEHVDDKDWLINKFKQRAASKS
ncbi:hypothetical protein P9W89_06155 [Bacillus cereus]|uniref:hypothetical protein n=1 Tax=Bacillus cereus TaxID=1396 RepID=UPI00240D650A|nr:hypothetical protein [Bacillus cereus]MCU5709243.1 hypothetical protein [Bacillus cereus]MDA2113530.1 hypothetical protein [Bacillus cereus]MDA2130900.1 hypothetical protein [Bacillus cereus]MDA2152884.1 hypothetical protein [Bacillus cereus]MDG1633965.1 hypothetical protein [Bacillus cereus]